MKSKRDEHYYWVLLLMSEVPVYNSHHSSNPQWSAMNLYIFDTVSERQNPLRVFPSKQHEDNYLNRLK